MQTVRSLGKEAVALAHERSLGKEAVALAQVFGGRSVLAQENSGDAGVW